MIATNLSKGISLSRGNLELSEDSICLTIGELLWRIVIGKYPNAVMGHDVDARLMEGTPSPIQSNETASLAKQTRLCDCALQYA